MKKSVNFFVFLAFAAAVTTYSSGCKADTEIKYVEKVVEKEVEVIKEVEVLKTYVEPVVFTLSEGQEDSLVITMTSATEDAEIYYTTDGSLPCTESILYRVPVELKTDKTIKAVAVKQGIENSPVSVASVMIKNKTITKTETLFEVTFNSAEGSDVLKQYVASEKTAVEPKDPVKEGFAFMGWYLGSEEKYLFSEPVESNITLTAHWEPVMYKVKLVDSDKTTELKTVGVPYKGLLEVPSDIKKEGYIFGDWYNSGSVFNTSDEITSDLVLIASWVKEDAVGNILLSDGTILPYTISELSEEQKSKAAAVFCRSKSDSADALTMGVIFSPSTLAWTTKGNNHPASSTTGTISTGYKDASDIEQYINITKADYPAFWYCKNYGTENGLSEMEAGWYLPATAELYAVYLVKEEVNAALEKINGTSIPEEIFWTANDNYRVENSYDSYWQQNHVDKYYEAGSINFATGEEKSYSNTGKKNVLAVRKYVKSEAEE